MDFKKAFISELSPAKYNPRKDLTDKDPEYQHIKKSIEEFGYVDPVIVNSDYTVIGGHQRLKVLKELGHSQIDVVVVDIPKIKEKALNIALNKITGEWDTQRLTGLLGELKAENFDISITGFDEKEFDGLLRELHKDDEPLDSEPQISRAEELRKEWGTKLGQMWQCGEHRIVVGDCTDPAVVGRVMQGEKADITFTSPPYNAGKTPTEEKLGTERKYNNYSDDLTKDQYYTLLSLFTDAALSVSGFTFVNIQMLSGNKPAFLKYLNKFSDRLADVVIWDKQHAQPAMAENVLNSRYEFLLIFGEPGASRRLPGTFRGTLDNVYSGNPQRKNDLGAKTHAATMPIDFASWVVGNFSMSSVYDPFLGSGTTMIACENLGRKCRGCEIDPSYTAVILERYKTTFPDKEIRLMEDK